MNDDRRKQLDSLKSYLMKRSKDHLKKKFADMAEPMNRVKYTKENFDNLFPDRIVSTPDGDIKLRNDQYKKLGYKDNGTRKKLLGGMKQTYNDPITIIKDNHKGKTVKLLGKSFNDIPNDQIIMAVVDSNNKGISTHQRKLNNYLNRIKSPDDLAYEKPDHRVASNGNAKVRTAGNNNNVTQLLNNIPQSLEDVKRDIAKANREALNNNNL